jgi:hypothetical protein
MISRFFSDFVAFVLTECDLLFSTPVKFPDFCCADDDDDVLSIEQGWSTVILASTVNFANSTILVHITT